MSYSRRSGRRSAASIKLDREPIVIDDDDTPSPYKTSGPASGTDTPATSIADSETKPHKGRGGGNNRSRYDSLESNIEIVIPVAKKLAAVTDVKKRKRASEKIKVQVVSSDESDEDEKPLAAPATTTTTMQRTPRTNRRIKRQQDSEEPPAFDTAAFYSSSNIKASPSTKIATPIKGKGKAAVKTEDLLDMSAANSDVADMVDAFIDPPSKAVNKGKGKARQVDAAPQTKISLEDFAMDSDDEAIALTTARQGDAAIIGADDEEAIPFSEQECDDDDEDSAYESEAEPTRKRVRTRRRPVSESELSSDDDEEDDEGSIDIPLASLAAAESSLAANPGGVNAEDRQYETAIQRRKREKRERKEAAANARALRTGKARKIKTHTQYEKNREQLVSHHPELLNVWENLKATAGQNPVMAEQPQGLTIKLLPFQLEGLNWLVKQEQSQWKGGALADEMGMGKTIQIISLLLSDRKKPNLVIAPTVAILQWRNEIEKYTSGFKVIVWHGANRSSDTNELKKADVVLASYGVLESAFRKQVSGFKRKGNLVKEKSAIHQIQWHRVVLDEAHNIKERSTNTAKGAFELKSSFRWCLSGTPLQNRVGELYSMIRFLGGDPFSYYYCKRCPCKSLHWQFTDRRHCDKCGHTPMHHTCFWNNEILKPIQKFGTVAGEGKDAFERLRLLLDRLMLRRTKLERSDDMGLPPRTVEVRRDMFNEEEEDLYESLYSDTTRKFSTFLDQGTILNNYSNIFTLLTRMRQLACHPDLVLRSKTGISAKLLGNEASSAIHVCRICQDEAEDAIMSKCRHIFCRECVRQWVGDGLVEDGERAPECPYCHATLTIDLEGEALEAPRTEQETGRQGILSRLDMNKWRSSTKIEALLEELNQLKSEDKTIKSLVFSQFVNFLDLIAFRLTRAGFQICRLEGNMSPEARNKTINHFMNNPGVTVFLVSLKAGGVALNLTEASRVFLMDPWWNPSVEVQAMDRIHRLGQHRPIIVKRMIVENSIESRIIELQNKKSAMIEAAIGKDESAMGRLSVSDLSFLFSL
jgi:DNA repair protein RAD16